MKHRDNTIEPERKDTSHPELMPVVEVEDLAVSYGTKKGDVSAVRGVSFQVRQGETLGIVGESGCGKSTLAYGIVDFLGPNGKIVSGSIKFLGKELVGRSFKEMQSIRGDRISMVYQDPLQALNPSMRLGEQVTEVLTCHRHLSKQEAWERSIRMLQRVNMPDPEDVMNRYPHQISGGQQQRVVIAMALINHPALLIMDEPTTALDVTVEATVLDLIGDLKKDFDTAIIFITHNLGVVARITDRVCVMYAGELVEQGRVEELFESPAHPYTQGLLRCVPKLGPSRTARLYPIPGRVPPPQELPEDACIFAPRCDHANEDCHRARPELFEISPAHQARCFYAHTIQQRPLFVNFSGRDDLRQTSWAAGSKKPRLRPDARREKLSAERSAAAYVEGTLLKAEHLKVYYQQESTSLLSLFGLGPKRFIKAVDDVSLDVQKGRTFGIVGESGCGKSTLVKGLIGLEKLKDGGARFLGLDISAPVTDRALNLVREMQMVFQNPDSTLNPSYPVGKQIARPIKKFKTVPRKKLRDEVIRILKAVQMDEYYYDRLPRQLSGGEKQRVGIARALASRPDLVICDEPVSALDVSVQAAVLNLLMEIQADFGTTIVFIAHDLSVVRFFCDDVAVMYLGQIVEMGPSEAIYSPPYHPYTEALLSAVPIPNPRARQKPIRLHGTVPSALDPPGGCLFHPRCPRRKKMLPHGGKICETVSPSWQKAGDSHQILCHIQVEELRKVSRLAGQPYSQ